MGQVNFRKKKKTTGNSKVKNAVKSVHVADDGTETKLDSGLELFFYTQCLNKNIKVEREPKFTIQPKFTYLNEKVREINMFPDFYLPELNIIVETKGFETDTYKIKKKMFIYHLYTLDKQTKYVVVKNRKEILDFINTL
jgi:protein-tyrosine phosphatase